MAIEHGIVLDFATVLGTSAIGGYIANKLRQPVILGYLVTGLIIGPFGLQLLSDAAQTEALAEIGVAFLLFALGMEFSLSELGRVRKIAIEGSLLQLGLTTAIVAAATTLTGWAKDLPEGVFLGVVLALSSTAVVLKTLSDRGETNTPHGQVMLAILIAQDIALGLMLAVLPALTQPEDLGQALAIALLKASAFLGAAILAGKWVVPRLMSAVAATESNEIFLLTTIAWCLGVAFVTAELGLSIEMGAFVAGVTIAELDQADQALSKILPLRDTFASLFFASIGMLIDPHLLIEEIFPILGLVVLVMIGKAAIVTPVVLRFGYSFKTAVFAGFGINQIGEFSFILAAQGLAMGLIDKKLYLLLLGTTAIALMLTPLSLATAPWIVEVSGRWSWVNKYFSGLGEPKLTSMPDELAGQVVVAGYGRIGQTIVKVLRDQGYPVLVIDNSEAVINKLREAKIPYLFGDADSELVLEKARIDRAKALAIALPDPASTRLVLQHALKIAPDLDAIARARDGAEIERLTNLGAKEVVQPEFEAALELTSHLLLTLGEDGDDVRQLTGTIRQDCYGINPPPQTLAIEPQAEPEPQEMAA
ncbi:MAG: cation:proton antiporter [Limnothrix sp.]|nr:cation:proton antiporter [Limnothrix sp.]